MSQALHFINNYLKLDERFYQLNQPTPAIKPSLLLWNNELATQLKISDQQSKDKTRLAELFSGSSVTDELSPLSLAYAGHQFGHFNPQLGDGRAHLLGQLEDKDGITQDVQLKGSGRSRFSRSGDGRCALKPALREYIMGESMHALGINTTRCLSVVATGETVYREPMQPGAVVTRIATSHLRVGSFQYLAAQGDYEAVKTLADFAITQLYPEIDLSSNSVYIDFFEAVIQRQINLIVDWMRVGFIHGVMNTDNCAISGQTIDYGPCAMMGIYHPETVFSSIDQQGRYAFNKQAEIVQWNMTRLAECLIPLINDDEEKAIASLQTSLEKIGKSFNHSYTQMMANKLGIIAYNNDDRTLISDLLNLLKEHELDYTNSFIKLTKMVEGKSEQTLIEALLPWQQKWQQRLAQQNINNEALALMQQNNPLVIARNHHMEAVLQSCQDSGSMTEAEKFLEALKSPYQLTKNSEFYQSEAVDKDKFYQTFCGT